MNTYIWADTTFFEYEFVAVNASSLEEAREMARAIVTEDNDKYYLKDYLKSINESEPIVLEPNQGKLIEHSNP